MDAGLNECLWLVQNNVPWDIAFGVDETMRAAMAIRFSIMNGAKFDLNTMTFKDED